MADRLLTLYDPTRDAVLPSAARAPWDVTGAGGVLTGDPALLRITGTTAINAYSRTHSTKLITDRVEIQAQFSLRSSSPAWSAAGHVVWIDDGQRRLGLAMGADIDLVDPVSGTVLYDIPTRLQPGESSRLHWVHLVKRGTDRWEVWVEGRRVLVWPYVAAGISTAAAASVGFGWMDAGGSGAADWGIVESGINEVLAPGAKVERWRSSMPLPIQSRWNAKHESMGRATVGLVQGVADAMEHAADPKQGLFTAGTIVVEEARVDLGDLPATTNGWTLAGDTGQFELVRDRTRINESTNPTYFEHVITEPTITTADSGRTWMYSVRALVRADRIETTDSRGRAGPFIYVRDGTKQIGALLVHRRANSAGWGWVLADGNVSDALGDMGDVHADVDPFTEHLVELFVVGNDRVILFVDGSLVEDVAYSRFTTVTTTDRKIRVGRDGNLLLRSRVDFAEVVAQVSHADLSSRAALWQRVKERLVFRSGCERNDRLEVWLRHRTAAFEARGTDRVLSEIRRVACDDAAALVVNRLPAAWYLGVTYPSVSPTFIGVRATVPTVTAEFAVDDAPNFTADQLVTLVSRYMLPHSAPGSRFVTYPVARLTGAAAAGGGGTQFTVASFDGFAVDDDVEMRGIETGDLLTVTYDSDEGLVDLLAGQVRDFSGNDRTGALTGSNATIANSDNFSAFVDQSDPSSAAVEGVRTVTTYSVTLSAGFTYAGRFTHGATHGINWYVLKTTSGVGTGGVSFYWATAGNLLTAFIYDGAGSKTTTIAFNPVALSVHWLAVRWDPATNELSIWVDGVKASASALTAFTMLDPGATRIGFGCAESGGSNLWRGDHRDHSLYTRALTDPEMATLYAETTGRDSLRTDAALYVSYLMAGWPAVLATHADTTPPVAADTMTVAAASGTVWARWSATTSGTGNDEIVGTIDLAGLDSHKLANMVAGHTLRYVSSSASEDCWIEAFGVESGTGNAISERVHVVGTTAIVGTKLWAVNGVHGCVSDRAVVGNVSVQDSTGPVTLYTIPIGSRSRGAHLFDPPLFAGPAKVTATADGATTAAMQVWGIEEALNYTGYNLTLSGTTPVVTTMTVANDGWDAVSVLAMGYVAAARTVTFSAVFTDPAGAFELVSSSASDVQPFKVFVLSTSGEAAILRGTLDGVTPVSVPLTGVFAAGRLWHTLGIELGVAAVGTITVTLDSGAPSAVLVAEFAAGEITKGIDRRKIANTSDVAVVLNQAQTTDRTVGVYGLDETGVEIVESMVLDGTDTVRQGSDIVEIHGFLTGHVPPTKYTTWSGQAWRYQSAAEALLNVSTLRGWEITAPGGVADGVLDVQADLDVTLAAVDLQGTWSHTEQSTVTGYDAGTGTVTVQTLAETYAPGDGMRRLA